MMNIEMVHDSRSEAYRVPGGAQPCGTSVRLRLHIRGATPETVYVRQWFGKESFMPMWQTRQDASLYEAVITLPAEPCLLWYDFQVWIDGQFFWYGNAEDSLGGIGAPIYGSARSFQITTYDPAFAEPEWTHGAVFYQIFPDRFARARGDTPPALPDRTLHETWDEPPHLREDPDTHDNEAHDFFGGTLRGIAEKLPYLASLGITALYINPVFHAGTNHRFDTVDWNAIDPMLGSQADFEALCAQAMGHGIRVVIDGVFSHSGNRNPHFEHARSKPDSPYRNWFTFEHWPDMYKSWWGFHTLPELNKHQPEVIQYFLTSDDAIVKKWIRAGASGWRIDVADELPMPFLRTLRQSAKETRADAIVIGEVWEDASNKISYGQMRTYCLGDTLDGVMNYPLRDASIAYLLGTIDGTAFKRRMDSLYENYPPPFARSLLNVLGSHDRARSINVLSEAKGLSLPRHRQAELPLTDNQRALGIQRLLLLLHLIVAMPGMPCVYYGDEAGMEGWSDPFNRGTFPWGKEDAALQASFAKALKLRHTLQALTDGRLHIDVPASDVLCVHRRSESQHVVVLLNRSDRAQSFVLESQTLSLPAFGYDVRVLPSP